MNFIKLNTSIKFLNFPLYKIATDDVAVKDGDIVAFIPPVCGG
jgi:molybdopterin converting factor small subunit